MTPFAGWGMGRGRKRACLDAGLPEQAQRAYLAPEERELRDVERQMEEELTQSHMDADRVIAVRADPDGTLRYLVKVRLIWHARLLFWRPMCASANDCLAWRASSLAPCTKHAHPEAAQAHARDPDSCDGMQHAKAWPAHHAIPLRSRRAGSHVCL